MSSPGQESDTFPAAESVEIERLREELRRKDDLYLRALADFDNFRKRVEREQAGAARRGKREVVLVLLEIADDLDRASRYVEGDHLAAVQGVRAVFRKLLDELEAQGVRPFESVGEQFDPHFHEAVGVLHDEAHDPGTIVDELQRGYMWGEEVLRPARVRVAQ